MRRHVTRRARSEVREAGLDVPPAAARLRRLPATNQGLSREAGCRGRTESQGPHRTPQGAQCLPTNQRCIWSWATGSAAWLRPRSGCRAIRARSGPAGCASARPVRPRNARRKPGRGSPAAAVRHRPYPSPCRLPGTQGLDCTPRRPASATSTRCRRRDRQRFVLAHRGSSNSPARS